MNRYNPKFKIGRHARGIDDGRDYYIYSAKEYNEHLIKQSIKLFREKGSNTECRGIRLDANNYSGCNPLYGDCPSCGG